MTFYAVTDVDDRVLRVIEADDPPDSGPLTVTECPGWAGWPQEPFNGALLTFSGGSLTWFDPRSLAQAKADRWEAIKVSRDAQEFGLLTWGGSSFDADERAQARIHGAVQLASMAIAAGSPFTLDWTLADNTVRTLSAADVVALGGALAMQIRVAHEVARSLRASIENAIDAAAVAAVVWPD